ncbi:kinase-like protein [Lentinus tigrinus ALCF2SS1-7]|uniref:kinase-like protein n=1 Tax=Lentinus tigrinus ALCF2SS1-7 TaxID=1328758 RepID=UPI0011663315|nr:kinase-like protein [Lentinus tigrinus ALCF2SS1-7]
MRLCFSQDKGVEGGFARVYRAWPVDDPQKLVAVKKCHVSDRVEHPRLQHEACALVLLQGHRTIPLVYAWGRSQFYEYLALELLDVDLSSKKSRLTLRNLAALSHQVLDGLEFVHSHGIVHCDIKPSNLMLGRAGASPGRVTVRIIDFGICRPFRDPATSVHLPDKGTPRSIGTERYVSLNGHLHHSPSRRDDVESLSYTVLSLMAGRLPWDERGEDDLSRCGVFFLKKQWAGALLAPGDLSVFGAFVDYPRRLEYTEEPDYGHWKQEFRSLIHESLDDLDPLYDPDDTTNIIIADSGHFDLPEEVYRSALALTLADSSDASAQEPRPHPYAYVLPESKSPPTLRGPYGHWWPTYTWEMAVPVDDDELLGDEREIVRARLDAVDGVPEGQGTYLMRTCPPEVMRLATVRKNGTDGNSH